MKYQLGGFLLMLLITPLLQAETKLTASGAAANEYFGTSVSISGDIAIVGANGDDDGGSLSGSAYIFARSGSSWSQQAKLTANDAAADDRFGSIVFLSGDTAIVGSPKDDDGGLNSGSAYIFVRNGSSWSQQAKLTASDAATDDYFGISVSISGDTAIVGARWDDEFGSNSGSAYIFVRNGSSWSQQAKLTASDASANDRFGSAVAISGDTAIVGAKDNDDGSSNSGSVYLFVRSGSSWSQQAKLTANDAAEDDRFGSAVAISGDTAIVGVGLDDDNGSNSGSAYIFARSGSSWSQQAKLTASDAVADDKFGVSVSISGNTAIVGADEESSSGTGSAYIFVRSGSSWSQQSKLTASDAAADDRFGVSVSISENTAIVGAHWDDDSGSFSGSSYVYSLAPTGNTLTFVPSSTQIAPQIDKGASILKRRTLMVLK